MSSNSKPYKGTKICGDYSNHGNCRKGSKCGQSHNIDIILDEEECKGAMKQKQQEQNQKKQKTTHTPIASTYNPITGTILGQPKVETSSLLMAPLTPTKSHNHQSEEASLHSAGIDSAMTGFIFAYYGVLFEADKKSEWVNRLYLSGKNVPLLLQKSNYA
eukprot:gene11579-13514_t